MKLGKRSRRRRKRRKINNHYKMLYFSRLLFKVMLQEVQDIVSFTLKAAKIILNEKSMGFDNMPYRLHLP